MLATPLQLATMAARLVTGRAVVPHLVRDGKLPPGGDETMPAFASLGVNPGHRALVLDGMNAVVNEQRGTAYAARITDPAYAMGGKSGTSQVRQITQWERDHGVRKASQVPWRERDHALFVAFAPVQTPRYVCAAVVEHGGADAGGGSAVAAPICRDVLLEAQRRDPARRVPKPEAMAESMVDRRAPRIGPHRPAAGRNDRVCGIGRRELTLADKFRGIQWGLLLLLGLIAGDRVRDAVFGRERRVSALGVAPDDPLRGRAGRRDRGRAYRRAYWFRAAYWIYAAALLLVVAVDLRGIVGMGAQRWIDIGSFQLQPSEVMKIALVLALARYFHCLPPENIGRIRCLLVPALMIAFPVLLVLKQPDLGTAMMLLAAGGALLFLAGVPALDVRGWRRRSGCGGAAGLVDAARLPEEPASYVPRSRARPARRRVSHPAIEDRARLGRAVRQGLPAGHAEPPQLSAGKADRLHLHDDRRGIRSGRRAGPARPLSRRDVYAFAIALRSRSRFGRLLGLGIATNFFLYAFINTAMVTGLIPVVGVPLPLISYGGTAMIAVLIGFGVLMNIGIHRDVRISRYGESRLD